MTRGWSFTAAERRQNVAPGVSPGESSMVGGFGFRRNANPGLTPGATFCRRSAAHLWTRTCR